MQKIVSVVIVLLIFFVPQMTTAQDPWQAVRDQIEANELDDLVVGVGNAEEILFVHAKGGLGEAGAFVPLPIASASKWLTSATILRLVEDGVMSLDDNPQDYISWWTSDPSDSRSQVTLRQLLSFTSGFSGEPGCLLDANAEPEDCAQTMYNENFEFEPGTSFFYSSTHMHIAGVMAVNATGESFNALFRRLVADPLEMSPGTRFDRPSESNPFLAGGARATAADYALFLQALLSGDLLPELRDTMFTDWTQDPVEIVSSPLAPIVEWHYGLGVWRECLSAEWLPECDDRMMLSSGGGLGYFPWIDLDNGYWGIIARRGLPLTGAVGPSIILAEEIRPLIVDILASSE